MLCATTLLGHLCAHVMRALQEAELFAKVSFYRIVLLCGNLGCNIPFNWLIHAHCKATPYSILKRGKQTFQIYICMHNVYLLRKRTVSCTKSFNFSETLPKNLLSLVVVITVMFQNGG